MTRHLSSEVLQGARGNRTFAACCCSLLTFGPLEFILTHPPTANQHKRHQRRHTATVHGKRNLKEAEKRLSKAAQICSRKHVRICLEAVHFTWQDEKTFICRALLNTSNNPEDFRAKIEVLRFKMHVGRRIPQDCEVPNSDWMNDVWRKSLRINFFLFLSLSFSLYWASRWNFGTLLKRNIIFTGETLFDLLETFEHVQPFNVSVAVEKCFLTRWSTENITKWCVWSIHDNL